MKSLLPLSAALVCPCHARSWWSIDIPALDNVRDDDPVYGAYSKLLLEDTYYLYSEFSEDEFTKTSLDGDGKTHSTPAPIPPVETVSPDPITAAEEMQARGPPTTEPTRRFEATNGNCPDGQTLHRLWLYDSFGDGWGSSRLVVKESSSADDGDAVFAGTLDATSGKVVHLQLDARSGINHAMRFSDGRRRRLDPSEGGMITGPSGTIIWDGNGNSKVIHHNDTETGSSSHTNVNEGTVEEGIIQGDSGSISWGDGVRDAFNIDGGGAHDGEASVSPFTMADEPDGTTFICLKEDTCYTGAVSGGTFLEEISWEVTRVKLGNGDNIGLVAKGVGDGSGSCNFSLNGICENSCDGKPRIILPTQSPTTSQPSEGPTSSPMGTPTLTPTILRSKKPVLAIPLSVPEDQTHALDYEEYRRLEALILDASPYSKGSLEDELSAPHKAFEWIYLNPIPVSDERQVQRWALATFYLATNGDEWTNNKGWLSSLNECEWFGVACIDDDVSKLILEQNHLVGEIPQEIGVLGRSLYVLKLGNDAGSPVASRNQFARPIPAYLSELRYLTHLNLEGVGLTSTIPADLFSSWTHLQSLNLSNNNMNGAIPKSISNLKSLESLRLGYNNFGGSIVSEIGELSSLKDLSLEANFRENSSGKRGFITTIPSVLGKLTNLKILNLASNALSGQLPMQLGNLISLEQMKLSNNFFEKQLPSSLGKLQMLEHMDISFNWLSSTIPSEFGRMASLSSLFLQSNYRDTNGYFSYGINGALPNDIGKMKNLRDLDLSGNYLTGPLPSSLGELTSLETLHLQSNFLQGPIPVEYAECVNLKEILLHENDIEGEIFTMPDEICSLPDLDLAKVDCPVKCDCCLANC